MADPILTDFFRAQVIFQGKSGLAEDRFVNSFVFRNDDIAGQGTVAERCKAVIDDFFFTPPEGSTEYVFQYMHGAAFSGYSVRVYDLGDAPPRTPVILEGDLTGKTLASNGLPAECATVVSLRTSERSRSGRGRIYIGPLAGVAIQFDGQGRALVHGGLQNVLTGAANRVRSGNGQALSWHILSQVKARALPVIGGYVDNAFDTQRRRGVAPTGRVEFGTVA